MEIKDLETKLGKLIDQYFDEKDELSSMNTRLLDQSDLVDDLKVKILNVEKRINCLRSRSWFIVSMKNNKTKIRGDLKCQNKI